MAAKRRASKKADPVADEGASEPEAAAKPEVPMPEVGDLVMVHSSVLNQHGVRRVDDVTEDGDIVVEGPEDAQHYRIRISHDDITELFRKA